MSRLLILAGVLVLAGADAAHAQVAGQWKDPHHIWRATCAYCHETTLAPHLLGMHLPPKVTMAVVRAGPNAMPPFTAAQISDEELKGLAQWLSQQPAPPAPVAARP